VIRIPPHDVIRAVLPQLREFFWRLGQVEVPNGSGLTSWYRDPVQNRAVGGEAESQHLFGLAIDVYSPDPERLEDNADAVGLVAVVFTEHVHIQALQRGVLASLGFFDHPDQFST